MKMCACVHAHVQKNVFAVPFVFVRGMHLPQKRHLMGLRHRCVMIQQEFAAMEVQRSCMQLYSSWHNKRSVPCPGPLVEVGEEGDKEEGENSICSCQGEV